MGYLKALRNMCGSDYVETVRGKQWHAPDDMAVEREVADFLHTLVRVMKPEVALETGCGEGYSTEAIVRALLENGSGRLRTCDTGLDKLQIAMWRCPRLPYPLSDFIRCEGVTLALSTRDVDLAFLDSSGDRLAELAALQLTEGGIVLLHDSKRYETGPEWNRVEIDTPRGLCLLQHK